MNPVSTKTSAADVLSNLEALRGGDLPTHGGQTWAYVYDSGLPEIDEVATRAFMAYMSVNGLDPTVFPSLIRLENDVVSTAAQLLNGDEKVVGTFTSGGTESCMLAVKAARDRRPDISHPEIVLPLTAHASFHKAARLFGLTVVPAAVDPPTFRADPGAVARAITDRTVLVVASAVSYAHGVVDPVSAIAAAAAARGVPCHVDACIGGWLLPYFRRLGDAVPDFDFSVPGVTSISVDLHKYAYCPKGASVILYRNAELRRHQYFACADWPGYTIINSTLQSTKSAGPLAAAWAVLDFVGDGGYLELARRTRDATRRLISGINGVPALRVLGHPDSSLVPFAAEGVDLFEVADELRARGWYVQPQLAFGDLPRNLHLTVTGASQDRVDPLLADLSASVDSARARAVEPIDPGLVAAAQALDPETLTSEDFGGLLAMAGLSMDAGLPARMAPINRILEVLPAALRERLLVEFMGRLYTPE
ncbi:MAG TPA: aspartate aminotransferase family protein [Candidatus Sulfotelmatobacter sp.]|nr:aspartate aminotransferase family protein [Candidatus Sulfotelmatobacter sp.]